MAGPVPSHAGMKPLDLIWVATDKSVDPTRNKIRSRLCAREYKTKKQGKIPTSSSSFSIVLCSTTSRSSEGACLIHDVGEFVNQRQTLKLRHYDISRAHFQGTAQRLIEIKLPAEDHQKYAEDNVGRLVKSMYGTQDTSHIWQLDYVNLICGDSGGFRGGKHSAALFHNPNQDVSMAVHGDDSVCLSDVDGLKHIDSLLKSKHTAKDMGTLRFEGSDSSVVESCIQGWSWSNWTVHTPLIISESGCNTNTKAVSTPREKLQDKLV